MLYTANSFDRADQLRKDSDQIDTLWQAAGTKILPFRDGKFWLDPLPDGTGVHPGIGMQAVAIDASEHRGEHGNRVFLGFKDKVAWFALDYSGHPAESAPPVPPAAQPFDLRAAGPLLSAEDGAILAYAQAIFHWHRQSRFCQLCGHANSLKHAGHVRHCSNPHCGRETFPRTDAAVIMLVVYRDDDGIERCLLGRSPQWPDGVYSTLAGFVEPGETLEDAVRREVFEEAGIQVGAVKYLASQPWPFPQSMMLGFQGEATSSEIRIDYDELADAAWFTRDDLAGFGNWGDERYALQLPRPDSISRHLIDTWLKQTGAEQNSN